jgi:hypothetical protein
MKAQQQAAHHAPNLVNGVQAEVLPALQQRDVSGRFSKGHTLRTTAIGRPRDEFTALARSYTDRYQLLHIAAQMAAGVGKFARTDPSTRLRAIEFCVSRGYGPNPVVVELEADNPVPIKRYVNIRDEDV